MIIVQNNPPSDYQKAVFVFIVFSLKKPSEETLFCECRYNRSYDVTIHMKTLLFRSYAQYHLAETNFHYSTGHDVILVFRILGNVHC